MIPEEENILRELRKMSKILTLGFGKELTKELEKIATSQLMKKIWINLDGEIIPKDIAKKVGTSQRHVNRFLKRASLLGIAANPQGYPPYRVVDYIPPKWLLEVKNKKQNNSEEIKNE